MLYSNIPKHVHIKIDMYGIPLKKQTLSTLQMHEGLEILIKGKRKINVFFNFFTIFLMGH